MGQMMGRWRDNEVLEAVQRLVPIADGAGLSMAQLALAWVLQEPSVASAIIGASRPEQIDENVAASGVKLDDSVLRAVDEALAAVVA
jgi:aryl-alcohol dehydrogenase-like predicted oxidoreductase